MPDQSPGIAEQIQQILHGWTKASMDILHHAKNEHYIWNSFWDIKVSKILQSD